MVTDEQIEAVCAELEAANQDRAAALRAEAEAKAKEGHIAAGQIAGWLRRRRGPTPNESDPGADADAAVVAAEAAVGRSARRCVQALAAADRMMATLAAEGGAR